jgi:hypothetical protein
MHYHQILKLIQLQYLLPVPRLVSLRCIFLSLFWLLRISACESLFGSHRRKAFIAAVTIILVSEIGDKTFFIAAIYAMRNPRAVVFSGAIAALVRNLIRIIITFFTNHLLIYSIY